MASVSPLSFALSPSCGAALVHCPTKSRELQSVPKFARLQGEMVPVGGRECHNDRRIVRRSSSGIWP
jgi:hypothetical protein